MMTTESAELPNLVVAINAGEQKIQLARTPRLIAICLFLADKLPQVGIVAVIPKIGTSKRHVLTPTFEILQFGMNDMLLFSTFERLDPLSWLANFRMVIAARARQDIIVPMLIKDLDLENDPSLKIETVLQLDSPVLSLVNHEAAVYDFNMIRELFYRSRKNT